MNLFYQCNKYHYMFSISKNFATVCGYKDENTVTEFLKYTVKQKEKYSKFTEIVS